MTKNASRADSGWTNVLTGLGTQNDKSSFTTRSRSGKLPYATLEALLEDPLGRRIVEIIPWYSSKDGFDIVADENVKKVIEEANERLNIDQKIVDAWTWARLYGGAACVVGVRDGLESEKPVGTPTSVDFLQVVDRTEISAQGNIEYRFDSPAFGKPTSYMVSPVNGSPMIFHHSRVVRLEGVRMPRRLMAEEDYWGQSVFVSLFNSLKRYGSTQDGIANLAGDFRQIVFTLKNLEALLASGQEELVEKRFQVVEAVRSAINALILGEGEEMRSDTASVAGLADLVDRVILRLCSDTGIPHTILLAESPSGLGATGESERQDFADLIGSNRLINYEPALRQVFDLCLAAKGLAGAKYEIHFRPIWKLSPEAEATARKTVAETDTLYFTMGLDPDVILKSRFGGSEYNSELKIPEGFFDEPEYDDTPLDEPAPDDTPEAPPAPAPVQVPEGGTPAAPVGAEKAADTALNGAQVASMLEILDKVANGGLPRESGIAMIEVAFNLSNAEAEKVMGSIGNGFEPKKTPMEASNGGTNQVPTNPNSRAVPPVPGKEPGPGQVPPNPGPV